MTVLEKMTLMLNTADSIVLVEVHVVAIHPLEHHIGLVYHQEPDEIYQPLLAHMSLSISLKLLYNFLLYTCVFDHVFSGVLTLLHLTRITLIFYHFIHFYIIIYIIMCIYISVFIIVLLWPSFSNN